MTETELSKQMRALADRGHHRAADLRKEADAFDSATAGCFGEKRNVNVREFMAVWTRARRLWCECSGEPLV